MISRLCLRPSVPLGQHATWISIPLHSRELGSSYTTRASGFGGVLPPSLHPAPPHPCPPPLQSLFEPQRGFLQKEKEAFWTDFGGLGWMLAQVIAPSCKYDALRQPLIDVGTPRTQVFVTLWTASCLSLFFFLFFFFLFILC